MSRFYPPLVGKRPHFSWNHWRLPEVRLLELTLPTPAENLALDEALLEDAESRTSPSETLRIWESDVPLVVVGRSSQLAIEVDQPQCQQLGIPILRRASGGAAIVTGPGCLMYAVVLSYELRPELRAIDRAHAFVLETIAEALRRLDPRIARRGTSDLASGDRKFSGNSMRSKRRSLLYHGTLLYDMPLDQVTRCLRTPPRVPEYRQSREHAEFVINLEVARDELVTAMQSAWSAVEPQTDWPRDLTYSLAAEKYSRPEWTYQR
jgi:lipoate-protein ligase A